MASGGAERDDGGISMDIDDVHMLLQVEHEQIQRRTFTNWINAQLAKRCPPSYVSDLFLDLRDGLLLLDLLEVMSGQSMKRQRGRGLFQQRANIEAALDFLKKKSIKLVNINIPDIIDGRPSIILGLIWTIILHCHIEELASVLSFSSHHSSLDSLASLDSSSSPIPTSPAPASPLYRRFRISAKKTLLMWVRDQCQKVNCSVSVKDFKSSWRSGEAFLAILCSLRPDLVDLSLVQSRSNQENLEEAFHLAEKELRIPRLLDPQDVDVKDPDEKSVMTYVAQFLQYSNDMPAPDDRLQLLPVVQPSVSSPARFNPAPSVSPLHQMLTSGGLLLMHKVVTEWQDLQDFDAEHQKKSPLQHLSTSCTQGRTSAALMHSQGIIRRFTPQTQGCSEERQPFETASQAHIGLDTGCFVLARTKYVDQIGNVSLQDPTKLHTITEDRQAIVAPPAASRFQPVAQTEREAESETISKPQASTHHPPKSPSVFGSTSLESLVVSAPSAGLSALHAQNIRHEFRAAELKTSQRPAAPRPPVVIQSEVQSKARSMARSRLEKSRLHLQRRIQQATRLFGGKELTESQVKKKQKALKLLQPASLAEFLSAVEAFGAFCSGPQLQDLMLVSDSVRTQWEDVCREMAAFVHSIKSKVREEKQPFSVLQCERFTNADQTDHEQQQIAAQGSSPAEEPFESLRDKSGTLTSSRPSSLATEGRRQLEVNTPLSPADPSAEAQPTDGLKPNRDGAGRRVPPVEEAVHVHRKDHILKGGQGPLQQSGGSFLWEETQKLSVGGKEQLLKAQLLHATESSREAQTHIQAVVRSNSVEGKREAEWTVISESAVPPQEEHPAALTMASLEKTAGWTESAGDQEAIIREKLDQIIGRSVDISALTVPDAALLSDLKEIEDKLEAGMRTIAEQSREEDRRGPAATPQPSLSQPMYRLEQLRQLLDEVQSAVLALHRLLATLRDIKAEIPALLANQDPSRHKSEPDQEEERRSWQKAVQKLKHAVEQSCVVDGRLQAVGVTLNMDGAPVTCQDVVKSVSQLVMAAPHREEQLVFLGRMKIRNLRDTQKTGTESAQQSVERSGLSAVEKSTLEAERRKQVEVCATKIQGEEETQTCSSEAGLLKSRNPIQRRSSSWIGREHNEGMAQRKDTLLTNLREIKGGSEELRLQEPSLPALQHRTRVLMELESGLAVLVSERQLLRDASSQPGSADEDQTREVEDLWQEATKSVTERLEQCNTLMELLKKFQKMHGGLSATLQRAESTVSEQASYVGRDYLQRLKPRVDAAKAELNDLGDDVEEIRSICRQLQSLLRQVPGCTATPYEREAEALMDRWLDLSERIDSHLENLHLCSTLWDGVLQLGTEVEDWTDAKLSEFTQNPCLQSEDDIKALQNEIMIQEESVHRFHQRAAEIQSLLQSSETPLELQVVGSQMRQKIEQLKEVLAEAEDVYKQTVATKGQIHGRITECLNSLQKIQDSLRSLAGPDVASVLAKLKELCLQLHTQDEQSQSLLEDVNVLASVIGPVGLQNLSVSRNQPEESVRNTHQLLSEVEEQTQKSVLDLDRLQTEREHLEKWFHAAEEKVLKGEELSVLQEEASQQSVRSDLIAQLVLSLRSSSLHQLELLEQSCKLLGQYHNFHSHIQGGSEAGHRSVNADLEEFQLLSKSVQSWMEDLRGVVESSGSQSPVEQRLHSAQVVLTVTAEWEARLEKLRVSGNRLKRKLHRDVLNLDVQGTIQKAEDQWRSLFQSVQPCYRVLQDEPELVSAYLANREDAHLRLKQLQHQAEQLPASFSWPGAAERAKACHRAHQLLEESKSLQLTFTGLDEKRMELQEKTSSIIWKDSSWADLDRRWSALTGKLECLHSRLEEGLSNEEHFSQLLPDCHHNLTSLQEMMSVCQARKDESDELNTDVAALELLLKDTEKDLSQLETLRDSLTTSCTAEARASLSENVGELQNHKRAMESSIYKQLQAAQLMENPIIQQVGEEASRLQTELRGLVGNLSGMMSPDISQLTQQWCLVQDWDKRMTELAARVNDLQRRRSLNVGLAYEELNRLSSVLLQMKRECAETAAETVRGIINQLQQWRRTPQADLGEGFLLQQALCEVLSKQNVLINCFGAEVTKTLVKSASDALIESQPSLNLPEYPVGHVHSRVQIESPNRRAEDSLRNEDKTIFGERKSPSSSASAVADRNKEADQDHDNHNVPKGVLKKHLPPSGATAEGAGAGKQNLANILNQKDVSDAESLIKMNKDDASMPIQALCSEDPDDLESITPSASQEMDLKLRLGSTDDDDDDGGKSCSDTQSGVHGKISDHRSESATQPPIPTPHIPEHPNTLGVLDDQEQEKRYETTKRAFKVELDSLKYTDPNGLCVLQCSRGVESCDPAQSSGLFSASVNPESGQSDWKRCNPAAVSAKIKEGTDGEVGESDKVFTVVLELQVCDVEQRGGAEAGRSDVCRWSHKAELHAEKLQNSLVLANTDMEGVKEKHTTHELKPDESMSSAGACLHSVRPSAESLSDFCLSEGQTDTSVLSTSNESRQTQEDAADAKQNTGPAGEERTRGTPAGQEAAPLMNDDEQKRHGALQGTLLPRERALIQGSMEPERTTPSSPDDLRAAGGSFKHTFTMEDLLSDVQGLVERSSIINRTSHADLNWYLKSSPSDADVGLARTVQHILACRYQPAQLHVASMVKQLKEAQEYKCCVQDQVATMESYKETVSDQWRAALLEASATVQVKAAQLDQVKKYHLQMRITRAFLEVVAAKKAKMSLESLGYSALLAEHLHALFQAMEQKKSTLEDLHRLSGRLSVHLSDAESSGALLAQIGDLQEEWRLLKGSIKRALQDASNSTSQSSLVLEEAKQLKDRLEAFLESENENLSSLELVCLTTDLKLYNQLYLRLQSQSKALVSFSLGPKEKDEIQRNLQKLGSLLGVSKKKLESLKQSCGNVSSRPIEKQLQELTVWAKEAENLISTGQKLALFPEEAQIQIAEMRKSQTDILSRRAKMHLQVEEMTSDLTDIETEDGEVLKTVEDLYETIADSLDQIVESMKRKLGERETLLDEFARLDVWLAETHAKREPCTHTENVSNTDISELRSELKSHRLVTEEIQHQLKLVDTLSESCTKISTELSPGESRYLVNRLSGLWTDLDGLLAHRKATIWELEELIHERTYSDDEFSTIQASLKRISADLGQQKFPLIQETSSSAHLKLMEHQCQAQELQHCKEDERNSLLSSISELQDRCRALRIKAVEQEKYLLLMKQVEESVEVAKRKILDAKNETTSVDEKFRLCQTLLVELPLLKTRCKDAAHQLDSIALDLHPSELNPEKEKIRLTAETLTSWERSVTDDIKALEAELLSGLRFYSELPAFTALLRRTKEELGRGKPVHPSGNTIDVTLQKYCVKCRNIESGFRLLEGVAQKENVDLRNYKDLFRLRDEAMEECHSWMGSLSEAADSLKDYEWAAQSALTFLKNAEATFLSAPGGFPNCTEEQKRIQQALKDLEDGLESHICHLADRVPQQRCLSASETEVLHITVLSQLLVGRAALEAQAQLRLESLQRCEMRQESHIKSYEDVRLRVSEFEVRLSELASEHKTSYDECLAQQRSATLLLEDLRGLVEKMEDLRAGCPMQGCGVVKGGKLGALWRRWASLRRGAGLLVAHLEQKAEEWKDITTSLEQCCSHLSSLQAEVPDSSTVEDSLELLAQTEMHQAGLEQGQRALMSLERRLEHALNISASRGLIDPGPAGKALMKIQEDVRSLMERNLLLVAAVKAEEEERWHFQEEMEQVEKCLFAILPELEACSDPSKRQELQHDFCFLKSKLESIMDSLQGKYAEIPADIRRQMQQAERSLQKTEEMLLERHDPFRKLGSQVNELGSGMGRVESLLAQRSPTLTDAQNVLKRVWDELDAWHSSLMLLESEVQDLAEDRPNEAQLLVDQLTEPQQLYQKAARKAEERTTFLSEIPACLQEFDDIVHRASCWLEEAQSWLRSPCYFTAARSFCARAKQLQLVLDDSETIRHALLKFRPVLAEMSAVCDFSVQEERLDQTDQDVHDMQKCIVKPLELVLQAVAVVEDIEEDMKKMEDDITNMTMFLSTDLMDATLVEHLHSRQVILINVKSMQRRLKNMERAQKELQLPEGSEHLQVFSRARELLQHLEELEQATKEQISQLESKKREEDEGFLQTSVSNSPEGTSWRNFIREALEVSYSEEEEDEEEERCHSSSSDTLTCSVPEDLEETVRLPDVPSEDVDERKLLTHIRKPESHELSLGEEPESTTSVESDHNFGSKSNETELFKMDSEEDNRHTFSPGTATDVQLKAAAAPDLHKSPKQETVNTALKFPLLEEMRLMPPRPRTPFSVAEASDELPEEEIPLSYLNASCQLEGSVKLPGAATSSAEHEDDDTKSQRWRRLHVLVAQKLNALRGVLEEQQEDAGNDEKVEEKKLLMSAGSASGILQQVEESIMMLRQMVKSSGGSHPDMEGLCETLWGVLLSLDPSTSSAHGGEDQDDPHLKLLKQECLSAQLMTLTELVGELESEIRPVHLTEDPDAHRCLTGLQDCLHSVQLVLMSSHKHPGLQNQHQELSSNLLLLLDQCETGPNDLFLSLKNAPSLEDALSRHLRNGSGEKLQLQNASQSLLRGMARLLQLGDECLIERRMGPVPNRSRLQAALCRHQKLLQVLRSQLAFLQYLFQHEPNGLQGQEDEWMQLEVRAKARQQQALEQEVASEKRIQEWICWESLCARLGRVLDESETIISRGEPEGDDDDDDDEESVQCRLDTCELTLLRMDQSRVLRGEFLDQRELLQAEPWFLVSVSQAGGALELRWRSSYRQLEKEIKRLRDLQDSRTRFQSDFSLVSERLLGASQHLKTLSSLADSSDLSHDGVQSSLVKLLDISMELEAASALRESVSKDAAPLLHLRRADCLKLRTLLSQLDASCSQMTSDLSQIQDRLQQGLLVLQPPLKLLSELENWLKKVESEINRGRERVREAKSAAHFAEILQKYQVLRTAVANVQHLLDFMSQPGPQMAAADLQAPGSERSTFAEGLGNARLEWLLLQRELETRIRDVEHIHHACAEREAHLQRLHGWMEEQRKQLHEWKRPTSQTLAQKTLLEWEAVDGRVKEVSAALKELRETRVYYKNSEKHPSDVAFAERTACVSQACVDLSKQMEALRPALQEVVEEWTLFRRALGDVALFATRVRCALQRQRAPFFSLKQAEGCSGFLQELQVKVEAEQEQLWTAVEESYRRLLETLHEGTAQALGQKVEEERKRWKETVQQVKDERIKTGEIFSLWKEYSQLSDGCSRHLQHLWHEWEESSGSSPEKDPQALVSSLKKLQGAAEELQSGVGGVQAASKHLIGRLEPLAAGLIQSETRLLTRDVLLLNQAISGKTGRVQEDLEQQKHFQTQADAVEEQMRKLLDKLQADMPETDSGKQVLSELSHLVPLLVYIRETSGVVTLNNREVERVQSLCRQWVESMKRASDRNRHVHDELQPTHDFQEKCEELKWIQEKLERESVCRRPQSYSDLLEMLPVQQRLQAEIITGNQVMQDLLCEAVRSMEKETGEKRSEIMMQAACMKRSWFGSLAVTYQNWISTKNQLQQWGLYRRGLKCLTKLLGAVGSLLPPTGPSQYTLHQQQSCMPLYQCVEDLLNLHSGVHAQTVEGGKRLCETMTESEGQSRLLMELRDVEEAWKQTSEELKTNKNLIFTAVQMWARCQGAMSSIQSQLDAVRQQLTGRPGGSEEETLIQETALSLQRLATGLEELATMKTDLSQYVAASDSALLEQQLEQLHCQWEELCMKVSLRRQEIADRLNAWTIFNDKNKEFCDWLTQMENKVCQSGDLSIEERVEKLKKDCMEEINLFSENKSHLMQLGEQLLLASDEAKQGQVRGSLQEVSQRWRNLFHHVESRVKKLKETLATVQQLDKNMSNLRSWLSRVEAELSRPITYSVCHEQEIQRRLAEHQELQRDIEQHTQGVASVLSLCDALLRDEDAAGGSEAEGDSLQETSRSLDQRWRTICAMALDRRLQIEETWTLWCRFLNDYSRFEDWLKMAERTAANPNSADVLFSVAKEELKKFESLQRQVHERLTQLELVNNQYRRLARENRTDRASHLKAMVSEGNRRWDTLHHRVTAILHRLKPCLFLPSPVPQYFTSQREEFESTRESMLVWLTELDLQLTNVEHFSESDVHQKIQQLNSFQKEITLNTERIDSLIVFGEGLIQKSSPQDAALIEDELEELHSYCQEVFSRLVRFHQRLSQPPMITEEPELTFSLETSLELIERPWLGRSQGSLPATPTHLLNSPLERSGQETPVSVDSLPLEWDHTVDVGGSSHEDDEEEEEQDEGAYFSALSVSSGSRSLHDYPIWRSPEDPEDQVDSKGHPEATPTLTSTPLKQSYLCLTSQCSGSIENIKRVSLILDDEQQQQEMGLTELSAADRQSGVIERWELLRARSRCGQQEEPQLLTVGLDDITSWLEIVIPELDRLLQSDPVTSIEDMEGRAKELKELEKQFSHHKSIMLTANLQARDCPDLQEKLVGMNRGWSRACTGLQRWDSSLRRKLTRCQEFHEQLHSLLLWLAHAESRCRSVDVNLPGASAGALQRHTTTLTELQEELCIRGTQHSSLQALWSQLQPEAAADSDEAQEKIHVTGKKLKQLVKQVDLDLHVLQQRLDSAADLPQEASQKGSTQRELKASSPPPSFFYRLLRAVVPLQLLFLLLLLLPCLIPLSESDHSCTVTNNFGRSFYPMLRYTNGPPPT
nr:nesprin-2 isoform X2 [Nothobranchius furzeri]